MILALDVGTSSCRAALYDTRGRIVPRRFAQIAYRPTLRPDGGAELDPRSLLGDALAVIDRVLADPLPAPVLGVATTSFWHSLLGLDRRGTPVTPIYLWLDSRARADLPTLRHRLDEAAVHARTGCVLHWTYWPAKLTWLRRTSPARYARVDRWVGFGEYLLQHVTGQRAVSVSMASATGLLDVRTCAWDTAVLQALDLDPDRLSPLVSAAQTSVVKRAGQSRWPALTGVPWFAALGDGATSNVGAGCTTADSVAIMIGTSGAERLITAAKTTVAIPTGTWCYRLDQQRLVRGAALNDGGSLFDWLQRTVRLPSRRAAEGALAARAADSHGLTVLPYWGGERNPNWSDDARGTISGLRLQTEALDILQAAMEGVALRFRELDRLIHHGQHRAGQVVATGGALLRSPAFMQILADVLERPVHASAEAEASSRGASLMALEALHLLAEPLEQSVPKIRRTYRPRAERSEVYRRAAQRHRDLYAILIQSTT